MTTDTCLERKPVEQMVEQMVEKLGCNLVAKLVVLMDMLQVDP